MDTVKHNQRKRRVRARIRGTAQRPRASVVRSLQAISIQLIDDKARRTLVAARQAGDAKLTKTEAAREAGKQLAAKALKSGIKSVVFDRSGYRYHGRVKAVAEGMREGGLQF